MSSDLLNSPAAEGARQVALDLLDQAVDGAGRLLDPADPEALHDFRVSIRRLRSILRAYQRVLRDTVGRKWAKRLRSFGRRTNAGRDGEVQVEWLAHHLTLAGVSPTPPEMVALDDLLRSQTQAAYAEIRDEVLDDFTKAETRLRRRLSTFHREVRLQGDLAPERSFRQVTGDLIREHTNDLWGKLAQIQAVEDEEDIHDARISAKRLRYLLEPLRGEVSSVKGLLKWLKRLQDILGELNDMQIMVPKIRAELAGIMRVPAGEATGTDGSSGVAAPSDVPRSEAMETLHAMLQQTRLARYRAFEEVWRSGSAESFLGDIYRLAGRLQRMDGTAGTRVFLLSSFPSQARRYPAEEITHGWLDGDRIHERLTRHASGDGKRYTRRVELPHLDPPVRSREALTEAQYKKLWRLTQGARVKKRRFTIEDKAHPTWEIDRIAGLSLVLARTRLEGPDPVGPTWILERIVREVTEDPAFSGRNLAR